MNTQPEGRDFQIIRAVLKDFFRESGIDFRKDIRRSIMSEVKNFNERHKLNPPITSAELLNLYTEVLKELAAEYFEKLYRIQAEFKKAK